MISFQVNDMTCGHCVGAITQAIQKLDAGATVHIDLATHRVDIESGPAHAGTLRNAIEDAGYTPVLIESSAGGAASGATPRPEE
jgi:copper chaperone